MLDIEVRNEGTIIQVRGVSDEGRQWLEDNAEVPSWARMGPWISGDHRPMRALIEGAIAEGLVVQ